MKCKGLKFRYTENAFIGKGGELVIKKGFRPLKRQSCDGSCEQPRNRACDKNWIPEWLHEDVSNGCIPRIPKEIKDQDIVQLKYISSGGSYEYPDEVDIDFYFEVISASPHNKE